MSARRERRLVSVIMWSLTAAVIAFALACMAPLVKVVVQ